MKTISIIGLGLIGSSIARGLQGKYKIIGFNRRDEVTQKALKNGVIDVAAKNLEDAVRGADIVVIATPLGTYEEIATQISEFLEPGTVVTDVGSVKTHAVFSIYKHMPPGVDFVPAHPIAGKESTGLDAGDGKLFVGKKAIITPLPKNRSESIQEVENLWKDLGSITEQMTPAEHDKIYACVSHIPQLLAYAYSMAIHNKRYAIGQEPDNEIYKRFTRIRSSDAVIWAEIFMINGTNISKFLEKLFYGIVHIDKFSNLVEMREELGDKEFAPKLTGNKKFDAATIIFPALLGNLLLFCAEDELENNLSRGFSAADIHESLAMLEQQVGSEIQKRDYAEYAGTGLRDFTVFSLCDVSELVADYEEEIQLLKMLLHRKIFEITAAMESDSVEHLTEKLKEAQIMPENLRVRSL